MNPGKVGDGMVRTWYPAPYSAPRKLTSFWVFPSLPVPDMRIARGAGLSWAENQTRSLRSNQKTAGSGRAQGNSILISSSGTRPGMGARSCGGVPNTVERRPAESASPAAGPGDGGG